MTLNKDFNEFNINYSRTVIQQRAILMPLANLKKNIYIFRPMKWKEKHIFQGSRSKPKLLH